MSLERKRDADGDQGVITARSSWRFYPQVRTRWRWVNDFGSRRSGLHSKNICHPGSIDELL